MTKLKKYEFAVNGEKLKLEGKSYAECFRQFWAHFIEEDIEKTIKTIEYVNIRTSNSEYFVAKNGSKKKNILVQDDFWVYTHLTPKAMEKAYEKFIMGWEGKYEQPEAQPEKDVKEKPEAEPETNDDVSNTEIEESQEKEITLDDVAMEHYGVNYEDLLPSQKGVVSKKLKKIQKENAKQLTTEELSEVQL